jgi:carboxymethylenebutenolidase
MKNLFILLICCAVEHVQAQDFTGPDTVTVQCGTLRLKGLLWHPSGPGPSPAVIFCHGNYASTSTPGTVDALLGATTSASLLGPVFARHGYTFFALFRKGVGLSAGEGDPTLDLLLRAMREKSLDERNALQVRLLETDQLEEIQAGVRYLRARHDVDSTRMAVLGHSFGGSLALILTEHNPALKAAVTFGAGAYSWTVSPRLRQRLTESVARINVPVLFIHAKNDYSTSPADSLGAVLKRLGRPHSVIIYPPFGNNTDAGHNFIFLGIPLWEHDVMRFLDANLRNE